MSASTVRTHGRALTQFKDALQRQRAIGTTQVFEVVRHHDSMFPTRFEYHRMLKQSETSTKLLDGTRDRVKLASEAGKISATVAMHLNEPLKQTQSNQAVYEWQRGVANQNAGLEAAATARFQKAIAADKNYAPAYHSLGFLAQNNLEYERARELYNKALSADPSYAPSLTNLAQIESLSGNREKAIEYARRALALRPDYSTPKRILRDLGAAETSE